MAVQTSLYRQILQDRQNLYNEAVAAGAYTPFVYPQDALPVLLLAAGILLTPRFPGTTGRIARIALSSAIFTYVILRWPYLRTAGVSSGYGIGLASFWGLVMTVNLLILHDPGKDFRRIEIRKEREPGHSPDQAQVAKPLNGTSNARRRVGLDRSTVDHPSPDSTARVHEDEPRFVWQDYPSGLLHRIDWAADLMTSFRGINWNFRIPIKTYMVPPPEGDPPELSEIAKARNLGALSKLRHTVIYDFVYLYVMMDVHKTFMVTDPYWLGLAPLDSTSPWEWLSKLNSILPGATRFFRLSMSLTAVITTLSLIFSLSPLFFATVLPYILGDKLYAVTKSPLEEVWMYPSQWGFMIHALCKKGLAGMWSTWWHQMFRYGISEPARLVLQELNISPRGQWARALQLSIAFGLTAGIHAAASSTTFSMIPSKPWHPFIFFISQAMGIMIQTEVSKRLNGMMRFSRPVRDAGNLGFVVVFLWYIGPYLADDFARCQVWLFEPVPISIMRGLGFGPGDCWLPWLSFAKGSKWIWWWDGGKWYLSGIGIF